MLAKITLIIQLFVNDVLGVMRAWKNKCKCIMSKDLPGVILTSTLNREGRHLDNFTLIINPIKVACLNDNL